MTVRAFIFLLFLFCSSVFSLEAKDDFVDIFQRHSAVMLLIDPDNGKIIQVNQAASQFYGYSEAEFSRLFIQDINIFSAEQVANERRLAKEESRNFFIFRHRLANGEARTVEVYSTPMNIKGKTLLFSIIQDVSAEREFKKELWHYQSSLETLVEQQVAKIEQSQRQKNNLFISGIFLLTGLSLFLFYLLYRKGLIEDQNSRLSQIVEQSPVSIATTDATGHITYVNQHFINESGYRLEEVIGKKSSLLKAGTLNEGLYKDLWRTITSGKTWVGDFHNRRKNGETFWERAHIYSLKNAYGEINSYVAIKENITKQKADEKQLRLASTVFKTATEAVMITDANNQIIAVNEAFTDITGFEQEESIGKTPSILNSGHHDQTFYQHMMHELNTKDRWQGEICNRRKDGEVYYEWLSITALRDQWGELEAYVSLFSDITKRKKAEDKIYHQANFDTLTGLANRNLFIDRINQTLKLADRNQHKVALLFIDLDGFKSINDNLGHSKGDLLLQQAAIRLTNSVRKSDTVTRLGGDEFAVILADNDNVYSIEKVATKIQQTLARPFHLEENEAFVSASIGITIFPDDGKETETLLQKADSAMYKAKENGRNNYQFFTKEMDVKAQQRRTLEAELRQAVKNNEFTVYYQPIHDLTTGRVAAAEALVRWQHPTKGMIAPDKFIYLAEELGLISAIGKWVLGQACQQAKRWESVAVQAPRVAVNLSSHQFQRQEVIEVISQALLDSGLAANKLILEMTESLLIADDKHTLTQLNKIRELGVDLSIDDFGTGYSSLSYLKKFPINKLKIDRAFIMDVLTNPEDQALVSAIISMAHSLKLAVVAEGVEQAEQAELLQAKGCEFVQGYHYSKPLSEEDFLSYLTQIDCS